jgi:hypothetical protein
MMKSQEEIQKLHDLMVQVSQDDKLKELLGQSSIFAVLAIQAFVSKMDTLCWVLEHRSALDEAMEIFRLLVKQVGYDIVDYQLIDKEGKSIINSKPHLN